MTFYRRGEPAGLAKAPTAPPAVSGREFKPAAPAPTELAVIGKDALSATTPTTRPLSAAEKEPAPESSRPAPERRREPRARASSRERSPPGSFDDHERLDAYRRYLSEVLQRDPGEKLPRMDLGRTVVIAVENEQGLPIADARVVIRPQGDPQARADDASKPALVDVTTAADGRAMFLSGMDGGKGSPKFSLAVYPPGSSTPRTQVLDVELPICRVRLPSVPEQRPSRLDLALVVDCTGSMGDELEYLKAEMTASRRRVHHMFPGVDQRFALVAYRDQGDEYATRSFDFTGSLEGFRSTPLSAARRRRRGLSRGGSRGPGRGGQAQLAQGRDLAGAVPGRRCPAASRVLRADHGIRLDPSPANRASLSRRLQRRGRAGRVHLPCHGLSDPGSVSLPDRSLGRGQSACAAARAGLPGGTPRPVDAPHDRLGTGGPETGGRRDHRHRGRPIALQPAAALSRRNSRPASAAPSTEMPRRDIAAITAISRLPAEPAVRWAVLLGILAVGVLAQNYVTRREHA